MLNAKSLLWTALTLILVAFPAGEVFARASSKTRAYVKHVIYARLKGHGEKQAEKAYQAVLAGSRKHRIDPLLILAVIEHESRFDANARGSHGEIGLMQIKPKTAEWIAKKSNHPWRGSSSLRDPATNIALGSAYLGMLRERFENRRIYLAAYNAGPTQISRRIQQQRVPGRYAHRVMRHYRKHSGVAASRHLPDPVKS